MYYIITKKYWGSKEINVWYYAKQIDWEWDKTQFSHFYICSAGRCGFSNKTKLQTKTKGVYSFSTREDAYNSIDYPQ